MWFSRFDARACIRRFSLGLVVALLVSGACDLGAHADNPDPQAIQFNAALRNWSLLGPFPFSKDGDGKSMSPMDMKFVDEESTLSPPGPVQFEGQTFHWQSYQGHGIDFARGFKAWGNQRNGKVGYAYKEFHSPTQQQIDLSFGFDDQIMVYLDGEEILRDDSTSAGASIDAKRVTVQLEPGLHRLLLKVGNGSGAWNAIVRFLPTAIRHSDAVLIADNHSFGNLTRLPTLTIQLRDEDQQVVFETLCDGYRNANGWQIQFPIYLPERVAAHTRIVDAIVTWQKPGLLDGQTRFTWKELTETQPSIRFQSDSELAVNLVDGESGVPIEGGMLWQGASPLGNPSDDEGHIQVADPPSLRGQLFVSAPGYQFKAVNVPFPIRGPISVKLTEGGKCLTGSVLSAVTQEPISGASIRSGLFEKYSPTVRTDAEGRFAVDSIPESKTSLAPVVEASGFVVKDTFGQPLNDQGSVTDVTWLLHPAANVQGRVMDSNGNGIAGVTVTCGHDRFASNRKNAATKTDAEGRYSLSGVPEGDSLLHAFSDHYAPLSKTITASLTSLTRQDFQLETGQSARGVVQDPSGKPISDVWIVTDTWGGHRMFRRETRTAEDGTFELKHMPDSDALTDFLKRGFISSRRQSVKAGDQISITLTPIVEHRIVVRSTGGEMIEDIEIHKGYQWAGRSEISWTNRSHEIDRYFDREAGVFKPALSEPVEGRVYFRFRANGFSEEVLEIPQKASVPIIKTLSLKRADLVFGYVVDASSGTPVEDAVVVVATPDDRLRADHYVEFQSPFRALDRFTGPSDVTDEAGRFEIPRSDLSDDALIVVLHPDGSFLVVEHLAELLQQEGIRLPLPKAGKVTGTVTIAGKPVPNELVRIGLLSGNESWDYPFGVGGRVETNADGVFEFAGLGPGRYQFNRVRSFERSTGSGGMSFYLTGEEITVIPGTVTVRDHVIPQGQSLTGTTVTKTGNGAPNCVVTLSETSDARRRIDVVRTDKEGGFTFHHIAPGEYDLKADQYPLTTSNQCGLGSEIGNGSASVKVSGNQPATHVNVTIRPKGSYGQSIAGSLAPPFRSQPINRDEVFSLDQKLGKVIAIDFWATWCGPCLAAMPELKKLYEERRDQDDFELITISLDQDREALENKIEELGIEFPVIFSGDAWVDSIASSFGVRGIPASFVINRQGQFASESVHDSKLADAIAAALAEPYDPASIQPFQQLEIEAVLAGSDVGVPGLTLDLRVFDGDGDVKFEQMTTPKGAATKTVLQFPKLADGESLKVTVKGEHWSPQSESFDADEPKERLRFEFPAPITMTGQLVDGEAEVSVPGIEVLLVQSGSGWKRKVATDDQGRFEIGVVPGNCRIAIQPTDQWANEALDQDAGVDVVTGIDRQTFQIPICPTGTLAGIVYGEDGEPVSGARIQTAANRSESVQSDANGRFTLKNFPTRGHRVIYSTLDQQQGVVELTGSQNNDVEIYLSSIPMYPKTVRPGDQIGELAVKEWNGNERHLDEEESTLLLVGDTWRRDHLEWMVEQLPEAEKRHARPLILATDWSPNLNSDALPIQLSNLEVLSAGPGGLQLPKDWTTLAKPFWVRSSRGVVQAVRSKYPMNRQ
ncbi:MAG: carboxypeptidase regulatory-like domain-containing protein [Planctomycetota bacterium]